MTNPLKLGIAGLGTVGTGVLELMACNGRSMWSRAGREIEVSGVCARDKRKNRKVDISNFRWIDDPVSLAQSNETDVFVELIGGEEGAARASVAAALKAGQTPKPRPTDTETVRPATTAHTGMLAGRAGSR